MRSLAKFALAAALAAGLGATSLQKLGFDEMIEKSTGIVRGKVIGSYTGVVGRNFYTYYKVQVLETLKTDGVKQIDLAVPGGAAGGTRQVVAGAPELVIGTEYVIFYWTSKTGLTQVIGLSQGLFTENGDVPGNPLLMRAASSETMMDQNGKVIQDQPLNIRVSDMRARVKKVLSKGAAR